MIDSHCHLADEQFDADIEQVILRAKEAGVTHIVTIANNLDDAKKSIEIADAHENIFATVGMHPHEAKTWSKNSENLFRTLLASSPKVKAVGEIGLDYHYDFSPREVQCEIFRLQLSIAKELCLPCVLHCREAVLDLRSIVEEMRPQKAVIHCCTEDWEDVSWFIEQGHLLSFTGMATFPKLEKIRRTIRECPIEQMMIETDSPYLAPESMRGKRNEPAFVKEVLMCIAQEKNLSLEEVENVTTANAEKFFAL